MNKHLIKMRDIPHASNCIKAILKLEEAENKYIREQITLKWGDKTQDETVAELGQRLNRGRARVRGYQVALHELKRSLKHHNQCYDWSVSHQEAMAVTTEA